MSPDVLRRFLGEPRWSRWKRLLASAGVSYGKSSLGGNRARGLTHGECRLVMEAWFRELGEYRLKKWRGAI